MNTLINENVINFDTPLLWAVQGNVEFNNFDLTSLCNNKTWYLIKTWNEFDRTNIDLWAYVSSLIDWWWVFSKKYWNQTITFSLFIQWENENDLIDKIDLLKWAIQWVEWNLDLRVKDQIRTYKATCSWVSVPNFRWDFVDDVVVSFLITSWVWQVKQRTERLVANQTDDFEAIISNNGTYEAFPIIYFITKNWTDLSEIEIITKNVWETTWNPLIITETITDTNIIIVDYQTKVITINWVEVPYTWFMTPLNPWLNALEFNFTWTLELDTYILYNKRFI